MSNSQTFEASQSVCHDAATTQWLPNWNSNTKSMLKYIYLYTTRACCDTPNRVWKEWSWARSFGEVSLLSNPVWIVTTCALAFSHCESSQSVKSHTPVQTDLCHPGWTWECMQHGFIQKSEWHTQLAGQAKNATSKDDMTAVMLCPWHVICMSMSKTWSSVWKGHDETYTMIDDESEM